MKYLLSLLMFFYVVPGYSGPADSLAYKLENAPNDSVYIKLLLDASEGLWYSNPDKAYRLTIDAKERSERYGSYYFLSKSYNYLGIIYDITSRWDSAMIFYNLALSKANMAREKAIKSKNKFWLKNSKVLQASILNNIGLIYWNKAEYDLAMSNYLKSLALFEETGKDVGIAHNLNNLALIYKEQNLWDESMKYNRMALAKRIKINDVNGIGSSYLNISNIFDRMNEPDSSIFYIRKAITIKRQQNDKLALAKCYNNLGLTFYFTHQNDSAIKYINKAVALNKEIGNDGYIAEPLLNLGRVYDQEYQNYQKAEEYYLEAKEYAEKTGARKTASNIYEYLGYLYNKTGKYELSNQYLIKRIALHDSIYQIEKDQLIADMEKKYQLAEKDKKLSEQKTALIEKELKVKRRTYTMVLALIIVVLIIIIALIIISKQRLKQRKLEERNILQKELAAANVKNKLNEERMRISRDLHDDLGSQLTFIISSIENILFAKKMPYEKISQKLNELKEFSLNTIILFRDTIWALGRINMVFSELKIKLLVFFEKVRQSNPNIELILSDNLDSDYLLNSVQSINLFRIIQESINNAIKHSGCNKITVSFSELGNKQVRMVIFDDGKGFNIEEVEAGNGLANMKSRIEEIDGSIEIKSEEGTELIFDFSLSSN